MEFNFFTSKQKTETEFQIFDENGFTKSELLEYDKNVDFYYTNLINSLILFTYNSYELERMEPILIDPLTELYEELDYAFLPVCFETIFRNNHIDKELKNELLNFKIQVDEIPNEIWDYELIDKHEKWKKVKYLAESILEKIGIKSRIFDGKYHKVLSADGKVIYQGPDASEK